MADHHHLDAWQEDGLHFFVFLLHPAPGAASDPANPPVAVFAMRAESISPVSAVVVTPSLGGAEAEIRDLGAPDRVYTAPVA